MDEKMPVFVKIDEYKDVLDILSVVKTKVAEAKNVLNHLSGLKQKEDAEIDSWKLAMDDIEKKMQYIDHTLFEPENL